MLTYIRFPLREVVLTFVFGVRTSASKFQYTGVKVNTRIFDQFERGDPLGIPKNFRLKLAKFSRLRAIPNLENHKGGTLLL